MIYIRKILYNIIETITEHFTYDLYYKELIKKLLKVDFSKKYNLIHVLIAK